MSKAKWEPLKAPYTEMGFNTWEVQCSACGKPNDWKEQHCPNCGAEMEGEYPSPKPNFLKKYYKNTTTFKCMNCKHIFKINWWQWLWSMKFDFVRHRHVRCPRCGVRHWLQAIKLEE